MDMWVSVLAWTLSHLVGIAITLFLLYLILKAGRWIQAAWERHKVSTKPKRAQRVRRRRRR